MAIGTYVGIATVGGAAYWFLYDPTGPQINYYQLSHFLQCPAEPENFKGISCDLFQVMVPLLFIAIMCQSVLTRGFLAEFSFYQQLIQGHSTDYFFQR